jgi:hypothetical protein
MIVYYIGLFGFIYPGELQKPEWNPRECSDFTNTFLPGNKKNKFFRAFHMSAVFCTFLNEKWMWTDFAIMRLRKLPFSFFRRFFYFPSQSRDFPVSFSQLPYFTRWAASPGTWVSNQADRHICSSSPNRFVSV